MTLPGELAVQVGVMVSIPAPMFPPVAPESIPLLSIRLVSGGHSGIADDECKSNRGYAELKP